MSDIAKLLIAGAAVGALAAPAAAQYQNYPYQPTYPQQYQYQQGYGYQGYSQNPIGQIIDQLLGNRYNVTDRTAVSQCASAAMAQATAQFRYGHNGYDNGYGSGYNRGSSNLRVTSITDVQRRNGGLRVTGLMSSGYDGQYGNQYGYQNRNYAGQELSFRCNVDYRGAVSNIRIRERSRYR